MEENWKKKERKKTLFKIIFRDIVIVEHLFLYF